MQTRGKNGSKLRFITMCAIGLSAIGGIAAAANLVVTNGMPASVALGQPSLTSGYEDGVALEDNWYGGTSDQDTFSEQRGVAFDRALDRLFVADTNNHRVMVYDVATATTGENAINVLGQGDFTTGQMNLSSPTTGGNTYVNPAAGCTTAINACNFYYTNGVAYDKAGKRLFVSDYGNNRVLVFNLNAGVTDGMAAFRVLGQKTFTSGASNAACGAGPSGPTSACGLSEPVDVEYDAPNKRLYVADSNNHRVVMYDLSGGITNGMPASRVFGQANLTGKNSNTACGGGSSGTVNACGFYGPNNVLADPANGRVFVSDLGNNRVTVFNVGGGIVNGMAATNVLGQPDFATATADTACGGGSSGTVNACGFDYPYDMALDATAGKERLYVGDLLNARVQRFHIQAGLTNGMAAARVLGQPDFATNTFNTDCGGGGSFGGPGMENVNACGMGSALGIAWDEKGGFLYVSDTSNHRVMVY